MSEVCEQEQDEAEIRLANQKAKWLKATASKSDIEELLAAGRISPKQAAESMPAPDTENLPTSVAGMDALGALIMRQFPRIGLQVDRQMILHWRNLRRVPEGCSVRFPAPKCSNRYDVAECFAWVQTYFGQKMAEGGMPEAQYEARQAIKDKIESRKLELLDIEVGEATGRLVEAKEAQLAVTGAVMAHHRIVKSHLDHDFAKLVLDNLDGLDDATKRKVQDAVVSVGRGIVMAIEADCEKYGR